MPLLTDRDLLLIEPAVFTAAAGAATNIITAADAATSGTTLTSAASDFEVVEIDAGHVAVFDGEALEIVERLSATSLDVSRPRASSDGAKVAPAAASDKTLKINTFARLIDQVERELLTALGSEHDDPASPLNTDMVLNPQPLAHVLALRTIERACAAASAADPDDASLAQRTAMYRAQAQQAAASLAVLIDTQGDGEPDETRHLSIAVLRRM